MTEQEAIERIALALWDETRSETEQRTSTQLAQAAWNEMKAIARETPGKRPCPNPDDHYHYIDGHEMGQA